MNLLLQLLVIILAFISSNHEAIAGYVPPIPYTSVVAQVTKHIDAAKPLYSVQIKSHYVFMQYLHANFLIDIDAPFIWHDCIMQYSIYPGSCPSNTLCARAVACEEYECIDFQNSNPYKNLYCPPETNSSTLPSRGYCTCPVNVVNPLTGSCGQALLGNDELTMSATDGRNVVDGNYGASLNAACAPSSSFGSFPKNVNGVMAFSSSPHAFRAYLYRPLKQQLALCLPSNSSSPGVLFYGAGPFYLLPQSSVDIRSYLSYTPLLKHPGSFGYFINVTSIVIKTRSINVPSNTTTKLSTIDPYTVLRTDIYNNVVRRFSKVTKRIPPAKPVAPFGLCFSTSITGLKVPDIDFILPGGKKWTISTTNSIKQITNKVACLAFVDGGAMSEPAIIIGTYQFEDNLLEFDIEKSTFGFSSSLLHKQTSCANFNFTIIDSP